VIDNILSLPDTFLRDVMKNVDLEDRLRIREVCRACERLVADTNAGFCGRGWIQLGDNKAYIKLGDLEINTSTSTEDKLDQILQFRKHLFSGVAFERFRILLDDNEYSLPFLFEFTDNFETEELFIKASSDSQLEMAVTLFDGFPRSKLGLSLDYCPDTDTLQSLPLMEHIEISFGSEAVSSDIFFNILTTHRNVHLELENAQLSSQDWDRAIQTISSDNRDRTVEFTANHASIVHWLSDNGIDQATREGSVRGEFHVDLNAKSDHRITMRYRNCWVAFYAFSWTESDRPSAMGISKHLDERYQRLFA
ncbi:hypothetical protein PENTCL1PPCAC_20468, partial [Pristionchus entomophagus]